MYQHFVNYYNDIFPFDDDLMQEIKRFIKKDGKAVDLGCGTGRLVDKLNNYGMNACGVDLDKDMISYAKNAFPKYQFYHDDMMSYLQKEQKIDLMTCFGNTIAHLNENDLKCFFESAKSALHQEGYLLVQLLNYDLILKNKPYELKPIHFNGHTFLRKYTYFETYIQFTTVLTIEDMTSRDSTHLYPHTRNTLSHILDNVDLNYIFQTSFDSSEDDLLASHISMIITKK